MRRAALSDRRAARDKQSSYSDVGLRRHPRVGSDRHAFAGAADVHGAPSV